MSILKDAEIQMRLVSLAEDALQITDIDGFIERVCGSAPALEAAELRELAVAAAAFQRVAARHLGGAAVA